MRGYIDFLERLRLTEDCDERAIRRAYARELKLIDQETDAAGFQSLRESYDAALFWLRHRELEDEECAAPDADIGSTHRSAAHTLPEPWIPDTPQARTADTQAAQPEPLPEQPEIDATGLADAVFEEFEKHSAQIAGERSITDEAPWQRALKASLADPRLVNILARESFERRIAELLASGWQPGHEALLVAATGVFNWTHDRRRILSLGEAGLELDRAINERAMYDTQDPGIKELQGAMIRRLRDPKAPSTSELIRDMSTLEMLIARFPTWLALITSVENIRRWRELDEAVPTWRRKLTFARSRPEAPFEKQAKPGGFNWAWIFMVGLIMIGRAFFGSGHGSHGVDQAQWPAHIESQAQSETPNSANDFVRRGDEYLKQDDLDGAWGGFDRAIQLEPKNPTAHLGRGMVYMLRYDNERAAKDFDDAEAFDPRNAILLRCRGILAMRAGRITDAIQAYSKSLELNPADAYARKLRAHAYQSDKQLDKALADADEVIRLRPSYLEAYKLRARIFMDKGDREKAKAQLELVLEHKADDAAAYTIAADIHRTLGNATEAMALLDRAVKDQNSASAYLARAARRPASDVEGRRSDIEATLKLEPTSVEALGTLAALDMESHRYADAIAAYDAALSAMATSDYGRSALVANRGVARTQLGEKAAADDDFMTAIRISRTASELNNICWTLAVKNVALSHALNSCNASLDQAPANAATLDSKGFVLLRMARYAEALKAYNASLKQRPGQADSQYCRGIVKRRLGDMRGGDADIATASARDSTLVKRFSAMGVNP